MTDLRLRFNPLSGSPEYAQPTKTYAEGVCWFDFELPDKALCDVLLEEGCTPSAMHFACFIGFMALRLGVASIDEILGDYGLVHEVAHGIAFGQPLGDLEATLTTPGAVKLDADGEARLTVGGGPGSHTVAELAALAEDIQCRVAIAMAEAVREERS